MERFKISTQGVEHGCCYDCIITDSNQRDGMGEPQRILETWLEEADFICAALNEHDARTRLKEQRK